jgi:hypothetical protein
MQDAIKRAVAAGMGSLDKETKVSFDSEDIVIFQNEKKGRIVLMSVWAIFYDPLFWQALGRAEGWPADKECFGEFGQFKGVRYTKKKWLKNWHRFIDHRANNHGPDSFFKDILK